MSYNRPWSHTRRSTPDNKNTIILISMIITIIIIVIVILIIILLTTIIIIIRRRRRRIRIILTWLMSPMRMMSRDAYPSPFEHGYTHITYIYIYIYREREIERERDVNIYIYIYMYIEREKERSIYIYIYIHIYIYIYVLADLRNACIVCRCEQSSYLLNDVLHFSICALSSLRRGHANLLCTVPSLICQGLSRVS